jgi:hypothetical protein
MQPPCDPHLPRPWTVEGREEPDMHGKLPCYGYGQWEQSMSHPSHQVEVTGFPVPLWQIGARAGPSKSWECLNQAGPDGSRSSGWPELQERGLCPFLS